MLVPTQMTFDLRGGGCLSFVRVGLDEADPEASGTELQSRGPAL
jgi:hypothetical protein